MTPLPLIMNKPAQVKELIERIYNEGDKYTYDYETLGKQVAKLKVAGIGLAYGSQPGQGSYIVCKHNHYPSLSWEKTLEIIQPLLEDEKMLQIAHNQLFDATISKYYGVKTHLNTFDTMVAAWALDTSTPNGLKYLIKQRYNYQMTLLSDIASEVYVDWHPAEKILNLDEIDIDKLSEYAVDDVLQTYRLYGDLRKELKEEPTLERAYFGLYQEVLETLSCMQVDGIQLDLDYLAALREKYQVEVDELFWKIQEARPGRNFDPALMVHTQAALQQHGNKQMPQEVREHVINLDRKLVPELNDMWRRKDADRPRLYERPEMAYKLFNPGSAPQLGQVLFNELGLMPIGEKKKTGNYSVSKDSVADLVEYDKSGIVEMYQRYKMLNTLTETFLTKPFLLVDSDERLRTGFRVTLVTGRLSSSMPNLQNIPKRTKEGEMIRNAFVAKPGRKLCVVDYSSMEWRLVTQFSSDKNLLDAFNADGDPHAATAKAVFDLDCEVTEVKKLYPDLRQVAKTLNYTILYGGGAAKVAKSISKETSGRIKPSIKQAKIYKEDLLEKMPGVRDFIKKAEGEAIDRGRVSTLIGRFRHVPEAKKQDGSGEYFAALREAVNAKIQGSASDFILLAMRKLRRQLIERGWWRTRAWILLQVHDELILEAEDEIAEEVLKLMISTMQNPGFDPKDIIVPIVAEGGIGMNWNAAKG